MPMCNLILYSYNYSGTSGRLWQFERAESPVTNTGNPDNDSTANSTSSKYRSSFFKSLTADDNGVFKNVKIPIPLKYLSNFWRSLEILLINCKIHLELNWSEDHAVSTIADTILKIKNTKLYVPIVSLSSKDNAKLVKILGEGFNRPVYWNKYQTKMHKKDLDENNPIRLFLDASFQGVKKIACSCF